ncbi:MAG: ABC transporter substrate-binding protein [Hyphomonadaceae bacterium JAD_PAG50586_4]|nr:MAG: ABC transporter substrate-binding protein [Hyphomonadaceae bacterium JAD_PAG50586_4]
MTSRPITRATFFAGMLGLGLLVAAPDAHAARNADAENYVQENATAALRTLSDTAVGTPQRRTQFDQLMARFADMPRISSFVLGRYGAQLRADAALRTDWNRTFQEYSIAVYEDRLGRFNGATIRVTDSTERVAGRDVIVTTEMQPRGARAQTVQWRLLRSGNVWKVVDVSLLIEGNQIWLAQQQQRDFLAQLDRNNGDIRALMTDIRQLTASLRQRVHARNS